MKHVRRFLVAGSALAVLAIAGVAFAAWVADGSGSGQALSTAHVDSVISSDDKGVALYPGSTSSFTVKITNPNKYPSVVTSISNGGSAAVGGCDAASVTSDARTFDNTGLVQADGSTKVIPAEGSAIYRLTTHMIGDPKQECESQAFSLSLTATLRSAA